MKEVNCNIVNDLMPLYVDGVLSEDSRELVEEHINECAGCRDCLRKMEADTPQVKDKDIQPFKKIRRKLLVRAVWIVILVCVIVAGVLTAQMTWIPLPWVGEDQMEVVFMEDGLYIKREEPSSRGDIVLLNKANGVVKFYIGESLWDRYRMQWYSDTCYTKVFGELNEENVTEVDYCDKDGNVLFTLWKKE